MHPKKPQTQQANHGDSPHPGKPLHCAGLFSGDAVPPPTRRTPRRRLGNGWHTVHESNPENYPAAVNAQETHEIVHVFKLGDLTYWIDQANKQCKDWFIVSGPRKDEISGKVKRTFILFVKGGLHSDLGD